MDVSGFLAQLVQISWYSDQIVHREDVPSREPVLGELETPLEPWMQKALEAEGIEGLYSHQAQAIDALRRGENVIVSTPAASGKSLCYHIPVLERVIADTPSYALYLFPTKALAQDQLKGLSQLSRHLPRVSFATFDGDTPFGERGSIRRNARIILTNPDMLHWGILPNHRSWFRLLRSLRYVVIDEAHIYRGVFGSHVANILRRLRRLCQRYGSSPQFILCSATIANPQEHAERLAGLPFRPVDRDGSPYGGKEFIFWNPPMIDVAKGSRRSTNSEATLLFAELLRREVRTLTFVRSRRLAELLYVYVRDQLAESNSSIASRISPYRATYLPEDRRRIEQELFDGRLLGVTATNALELGIDIGDLDATILTGYPGSIASTWQQAGRSGRRGERSLSILVAQDNPLDQYLMRHPETFFGKSPESVRISPENPHIIKPHLLCAAYEAPLGEEDASLFGSSLHERARELEQDGLLRNRNGQWYLNPQVVYPAQEVNIRSTSANFYTVVEQESGAILERMEEAGAFMQLYPGAIYLHQGDPYLITDLDLESHIAYAVKTDVPYYTEARDITDTRVLRVLKERLAGNTKVYLGEVEVSTTVIGFKRKAPFTEEVLGEHYVRLPPHYFNTVALWFDIPPHTLDHILRRRLDLAGGLHAAEHAAIGVLPLFALCDRNDIGGVSTPLHPDTGRPQVFIYDGHPGGVGITERGYEVMEDLWQATLEVIQSCPCEAGCPSCIQSPKCGNNNYPLDKEVAAMILREMLGDR